MKGFTVEGEVFATIEGLELDWKLDNEEDIVKFVHNKDTRQQSSDILIEVEDKNVFSSHASLKGNRPGVANIRAKLSEPEFKDI